MARARVGVLSGCGHGLGGVGGVGCLWCVVVCSCRLAELLSFVRHLSCLLSALVRGGLQFTGFGLGVWLCHWLDSLGEFLVCD